MSLEQLMAFAARLNSQSAASMGAPIQGAWGLQRVPRRPSLSAQEWAELFPESQVGAVRPASSGPLPHA